MVVGNYPAWVISISLNILIYCFNFIGKLLKTNINSPQSEAQLNNQGLLYSLVDLQLFWRGRFGLAVEFEKEWRGVYDKVCREERQRKML